MRKNCGIRWTKDEKQFIRDNYDKMEYQEIADILNKDKEGVRKQVKELGLSKLRYWTEEEEDYLLKHYGKTPLHTMSKKLNRSIKSIQSHMYELEGTADTHEYTGYLSTVDMAEMTGLTRNTTLNLVKNKEIPSVRNGKGKYLVSEENFWKWIKNNSHRIKAKKVPDYVLIASPSWYNNLVNDLIKKENNKELEGLKMTQFEKTIAWNMFLKGCSIQETANELKRNYGSVQMFLYRKKKQMIAEKRR